MDLEKAFDKIPRAAIQWALRRQQVPERLVRLVLALYKSSTSKVGAAEELFADIPIAVGVTSHVLD